MTRKILVVNPNTSDAVTQAYVSEISAIAPPDVVFKGVTGAFGAQIVSVAAEDTVAAYGTLDLIAKHVTSFDAVILAISFDSGLDAAQSILPIPVVGISHAALHAASKGGRRVGVIFFGEKSRALYEDLVESYDIETVDCVSIGIGSVADYLTPRSKDEAVAQAVADLVAAGAESIAILGTAIVGMAARLQPEVDVPLHDGLEALDVTLGLIGKAGQNIPLQLPIGPSENLSPELTKLLAGTLLRCP